jgi:hypothetical protein
VREELGEIVEQLDTDGLDGARAAPLLEGSPPTDGFAGLRDECRRVNAAAAEDLMARHREIHRSRRAHGHPDADGAFRVEGRFTPEVGAAFRAQVQADAKLLAREAKSAGVPVESHAAYCADALAALATGNGEVATATAVRKVVTVKAQVSARTWISGELRPGDVCEIDSAGPVPPEVMWNFATDALFYGIVTNGTDLTHLRKLGGDVPTALRQVVLARDRECILIGCHQRHHLEIDHLLPRSREGPPLPRVPPRPLPLPPRRQDLRSLGAPRLERRRLATRPTRRPLTARRPEARGLTNSQRSARSGTAGSAPARNPASRPEAGVRTRSVGSEPNRSENPENR